MKLRDCGYDLKSFIKKLGPVRLPLQKMFPNVIPRKGADGAASRGLFLTGIARSGTSWVSGIISQADSLLYCREPYNPAHVRIMPQQYKYLSADMHDEFYQSYTDRIFSGLFVSSRIDYTRRLSWFKLATGKQRVFIKDPTAALLTDWLAENYDVDIVILMRHPAAVVSSYLKLGWGFPMRTILQQERLMQDYLSPYRDLLEEHDYPGMDAAKGAVLYGAINTVLLRLAQKRKAIVVQYEDLCLDPVGQAKKLFTGLNLRWNKRVENFINWSGKETTFFSRNQLRKDTSSMATVWKTRLSKEQIRSIERIMEIYGLSHCLEKTC